MKEISEGSNENQGRWFLSTELMNVASLKTVPNVVRSTRERTDDSSFA